jgi:methylmalonyl-CoA/ethylmalonyl-CoA epimerase
MFVVKGISHLGIAPKDPQRFQWFLKEALQLGFIGSELVQEQKTNTHMFHPVTAGEPDSSSARLEVLQHAGPDEGPISKYLEKKGGGIHHIAFEVDNVVAAISRLKALNVQMIDEEPRRGAHQTLVAFVHPNATGGVLIELVQGAKQPT